MRSSSWRSSTCGLEVVAGAFKVRALIANDSGELTIGQCRLLAEFQRGGDLGLRQSGSLWRSCRPRASPASMQLPAAQEGGAAFVRPVIREEARQFSRQCHRMALPHVVNMRLTGRDVKRGPTGRVSGIIHRHATAIRLDCHDVQLSARARSKSAATESKRITCIRELPSRERRRGHPQPLASEALWHSPPPIHRRAGGRVRCSTFTRERELVPGPLAEGAAIFRRSGAFHRRA
jgi:hypothetical protein